MVGGGDVTALLLMPLALAVTQDTIVPVPPGSAIRIVAEAGEVVVDGWDRPGIGFSTARRLRPRIARDGDTVQILLEQAGTFRLRVPRGASLRVDGRQPTVHVEGLTGPVSAETESGPITILGAGSVAARSGSGTVSVRGVAGSAVLVSNTNTVRAESIGGRLDIESVTGMVYVTAPLGREIDVFTVTGEIHLAGRVDWGRYRLETHTGEIVFHLGPGSSATFDIEADPGAIDLAVPGARARADTTHRKLQVVVGGGAAAVTAATFNGAVRIQERAP